MSKGYEIYTIMKITACLITVAVVIFLVYKYVGKSPIDEQKCAALMASWCSRCQISGWDGTQDISPELTECSSYNIGPSNNNCADNEGECKKYIPF